MAEEEATFAEDTGVSDRLRQDRPHSARMYDYFLGGKTNYAVDRSAAEDAIRRLPTLRTTARVNRAFVHRSARFLARECGIRQFLDIGTGIPTAPNLHEVVQREAPVSRIVYVDNDPIVLVYADNLLGSTPEGATEYVEADLTDPGAVLAAVEEADCLDLSLPVGLSLNAVMHFVPDDVDPYGVVATLLDRLAPGSYLALSHVTHEFAPEAWAQITEIYTSGGTPLRTRDQAEVEGFFDGLDLVDPGVIVAHQWRPEAASGPTLVTNAQSSLLAGVARKG
ncbi:S-adenosyl methyltransferase [Actinacidiphila yanglinensis]|uniref:S-adenosyl methyltransferase n=1 Tax=Actinacidiphila yanglinensis TaxID=310779 RepID=A0A1H6DVL0_9ACTN|nr:SAM-dependent methyltransferase [Actinacidiphila yanglinensis]SEG89412.1 S-adenosyl methyltransferase [Actinacidiphila yanglinensis]